MIFGGGTTSVHVAFSKKFGQSIWTMVLLFISLSFHSLFMLHVKSPKYDPILNINNSSLYHFHILT